MSTIQTYSLTLPGQGDQVIEISRDELRSLLGEIEDDLHRSKVYRLALATLEKLLGSGSEQAKFLFKAVGREAIGLAFKQFTKYYETIAAENKASSVSSVSNDQPPSVEPFDFTPAPIQVTDTASQFTTETQDIQEEKQENVVSESLAGTYQEVAKTPTPVPPKQDISKKPVLLSWLKNKRLSKAEAARMAQQQRADSLRSIGEQIKVARIARGLSLEDLQQKTLIPVRQMDAIEKGDWESLPEDVYVRGFIRVMGNGVGLNGEVLSANLYTITDEAKTIVPSWYRSKANSSGSGMGLELRPVHLYVGYTALVAGAVGGLSVVSQQNHTENARSPEPIIPSSSSASGQQQEASATPGIQQNSNQGIVVGPDVAAPESL